MRYHQYAGDIQVYISVLGEVRDVVGILSQCLETAVAWIRNNKLQLNPAKMEGWWWSSPYPGAYHCCLGWACTTTDRPGA